MNRRRRRSDRGYADAARKCPWKLGLERMMKSDLYSRAKAAQELERAMRKDLPRIRRMEACLRAHEQGLISADAVHSRLRMTYKEAVSYLWSFHVAFLELVAHQWVYSDLITKEQYRALMELWGRG